jgi:hypothetical protein
VIAETTPADTPRRRSRRLPLWLFAAAAQLLVFVPLALIRYVDGDEGYYLAAAALALDGQLPYVDFFYQQMPLLPYVYGVWGELTGESWYAARLLSALFAAAGGVLLFEHVRRRSSDGAAVVALALYGTSALVLKWFPLAKTYALTSLLVVAAVVAVDNGRPPTRWRAAAAGVLVGLAVDVRLLVAAVVPAFAWHIARHCRSGNATLRRVVAFAGGLALGLAPSLLFFALDADRFLFDNLESHAGRSSEGLIGDLGQKARVAENLVGIGTPGGAEPQFVLLFAVGLAASAAALAARRLPLSLAIAALLSVASFLPTPAYAQYFCITVPFLALAAADVLVGARHVVFPVAAALALYAAIGLADVVRTLRLYPDQRLATVEQVADAIDARTRPGERVIVSWPGYLFGTHARPVSGAENDFEPRFAATLEPSRAHHYGLATAADMERRVAHGESRLLVVKRWHDLAPIPRWEEAAVRGGYRRVANIAPRGRAEIGGAVAIYERQP